MIKKTLVIIGEQEDTQALAWYNLGENSGISCFFLEVCQIHSEWYLQIHNSIPTVVLHDGTYFYLNAQDICWYLRGPTQASFAILQSISLLHNFLAWYAYPQGNYFQYGLEEGLVESKPSQLSLLINQIPTTYLQTKATSHVQRHQYITKSLSSTRSTVVHLADDRLQFEPNTKLACPLQVQERILGRAVKAHFYKNRQNLWQGLCIVSQSSDIDYRYAQDTQHEFMSMPPAWFKIADTCYALFRSKFFDLDFMLDPTGQAIFLEINFSPAPTYYEKKSGERIIIIQQPSCKIG